MDNHAALVDKVMNAACEVGAMRGRFLDTDGPGDVLLNDLAKVAARLKAIEWPPVLKAYRDARLRDLETMALRVPARQRAINRAKAEIEVMAPPGLPSSLLEDPDLMALFIDDGPD